MKESQEFLAPNMDYKRVLNKLISHKRLYITLILVLLFFAFLYNHFSEVRYQNRTTLYLTNLNNKSMISSPNDVIQSFGMFDNQKTIDNELEILKSFTLVRKVLNDMDLKATYFSTKDNIFSDLLFHTRLSLRNELYSNSPIKLSLDPSVPQATNLIFKVTFLNDNEYVLEASGESVPLYNYIDDQIVSYIPSIHFNQRFKFDDIVSTKYFNFKIQKTKSFVKDFTVNNNLYFQLNNLNELTLIYQGSLEAEPASIASTIIKVTFRGSDKAKVTDFLNSLTSSYLERGLEKKNKTALNTVDFIDSQISDIADSLHYAESTLKNFRTAEGVLDLSFQGQQVFEQLNKLENERAVLEVQKKYYQDLERYLTHNTEISDVLVPSSINVVDPILTNLITQLIALNTERAGLVRNANSQQNLYLSDVNLKIENVRKNILETVKNSLNTINNSMNETNYRMSKASGTISQMPKTELQLKGIERKFKLNDEIYTFLLQKRAEAQIARASSLPDYEIVDPAILSMAGTVAPQTKLNYLLALILGIFLPTAFVLMKDFLNNRISEPEEVEKFTNLPILGRIYRNFHRSKQIVNDHPNSSVTESFRAVRTNFQFFSEGGKRQVLLLTSSASGEGKSFCSMNLGTVFALNGHKTVLLEFDLRKPKIHQEFGSSNIIGISSFLIDKANIEDIILPTHIENLDLISAGPAAPNPAELINSERTAELIDKLKELYDYIIIDSAPAGILTETILLMKHTDLNIFVVRLNKTLREGFRTAIKTLLTNKIDNISILINDLNIKRESHKYGYDNKYYTDDKSTNFLMRLFNKSGKK
jgi:tyrosine-protein kinase Etk/Wzc